MGYKPKYFVPQEGIGDHIRAQNAVEECRKGKNIAEFSWIQKVVKVNPKFNDMGLNVTETEYNEWREKYRQWQKEQQSIDNEVDNMSKV